MKKSIIAALFVIAASTTMADESLEYCTSIGTLAETVMAFRQAGVTAMDMHNTLGKSASPLTASIIEAAFEEPKFSTESYRREAISEFVSIWFMACMKAEQEMGNE